MVKLTGLYHLYLFVFIFLFFKVLLFDFIYSISSVCIALFLGCSLISSVFSHTAKLGERNDGIFLVSVQRNE